MQWTHRDEYEVGCNWKVWLENAFENYHAMTIHRKHMDPSKPQNWTFEKTKGPWEAMFSKRSIVAYSGLPRDSRASTSTRRRGCITSGSSRACRSFSRRRT